MRFSSVRTKPSDEPLTTATATADIILQLGDARIPLKAEKLLGTVTKTPRHLSISSIRRTSSYDSGLSAEAQALAAVTRMLDGLPSFSDSRPHAQLPRKERYWSPDDIPHATKNLFNLSDELVHEDAQQTQSWLGTPLPDKQPMTTSERDFGTTIAAAAETETRANEQKSKLGSTNLREEIRRSQTLTSRDSKRPRKLDLGHFFTQTQSSKHSASGSMSKSPTAMIDVEAGMVTTPASVSSGKGSKSATHSREGTLTLRPSKVKKELEGDIFDPKTTKRHPPKGIQNWFDAYLSSDEGEEDEEEEGLGSGSGSVEQEAHELPADEIRRTEYDPPTRMQTTRSNSSNLTSSGSEYSGDQQCGHNPRRHHAASSKQDSVVSLTSSSSSGSDNHSHHNHHHYQRDKSFRTTSSIPESIHSPLYFTTRHWGPVPRPRNLRSQSHESLSGHQAHYGNIDNKPLPLPPNELAASPVPMRYRSSSFYQQQNHQHESHNHSHRDRDRGQSHLPNNSISSSHHDPLSPTFASIAPPPPSSHPHPPHHHLMHVTSEELALLSHLRQSHSRGLSFAEAYTTLRNHQPHHQPPPLPLPRRESHETFHTTTTGCSLSPTWERHHTTPSERRHPGRSWTVSIAAAGTPLPRLITAEQAYEHEAWLRRQFSTIRKTDVDCGEKIERFLKCQQQQQQMNGEGERMPVELEGSVPGEGHLVGMQMRVLKKEKGEEKGTGKMAVGGVLPDDYDCDYDDEEDEQVDPLEAVEPAVQSANARHGVLPIQPIKGPDARESLFKLSYTDDRGFGRSGQPGGDEEGVEETEQEAFDRATRNGSIVSFLSRQDSTKHLAHLRPENLRAGGGGLKGKVDEEGEGRLKPQPLCLRKGGEMIGAA